jgi:acyl-CoA reductase-like NAD-dependent aldehyde dehydrogenase
MHESFDRMPLYFGGEDHEGAGPVLARENPARITERVGSVTSASPEETRRAVQAAADAAPTWRDAGVDGRAELMTKAWDFSDDERDALSLALTRELGKARADTRGELDYGIAYVNYAMTHAPAVLGEQPVNDSEGRFVFRSLPYGVVAAIIPWNAPLNISSTVVGPALIAGNTVVVKPSPLAPLAVTAYLRDVARRLPPGVLNIVNGDADVGAALVSDPRIGKIAFTGSTGVGRHILRGAAEGITPSLLELGGNDAAVVLDDVTLTDEVVARLIFGSFLTAGQICMAIKRLLVHESLHDELVERYRRVAEKALVIGDPMDPRVTIGPLVSRRQVEMVRGIVEDAANRGASVFELGTLADPSFPLEGGYYLRPTLVVGAARDSRVVAEEQFGPTVPIVPFTDVDDAVRTANDSEYGLCASVWTDDEERAFEVGRLLEAGTVFVNTHNRSGMALQAPFGGVKLSGYGREYGDAGIREFGQLQTISRLDRTLAASGLGAGRKYGV